MSENSININLHEPSQGEITIFWKLDTTSFNYRLTSSGPKHILELFKFLIYQAITTNRQNANRT